MFTIIIDSQNIPLNLAIDNNRKLSCIFWISIININKRSSPYTSLDLKLRRDFYLVIKILSGRDINVMPS